MLGRLCPVVVVLLLALGAAGCSEDPEPRFEPGASPSGMATGIDSPSPSSTFDPTQETAEEFIRRWIRVGNQMQQTGDTEPFRAITKGCRQCRNFADQIDDIYVSGGFVRTRGESVRSIQHEGRRYWKVVVKSAPTEYRESRGAKLRKLPADDITYLVTIRRLHGAWQLTYYAEVEQ